MNLSADIKKFLNRPQMPAVLLGIFILGLIIFLQVVQSHQTPPLVPLVDSPNVGETDAQRMQFALGQAGISGSQIENGLLLVPANKKEASLKAIADNGALPDFLRTSSNETPTINPFLSRSQQQRIAESEKKREICNMVKRLPFVENADFEMDTCNNKTLFTSDEKTAVVLVAPKNKLSLDGQQVATVRQMIAGAVAGLQPTDIVVIDIAAGYAHRSGQGVVEVTPIDQRPAFEQEVWYQKRIKHAVSRFGDIGVDVQVDLTPVIPKSPVIQQVAARTTPQLPKSNDYQSAGIIGTNGTASIYSHSDHAPAPKTPVVVQAAATQPVPKFESNIAVTLDIPQSVVAKYQRSRIGNLDANAPSNPIEQLKHQLATAVRPVLPASSFSQSKPFPVTFKVSRPTAVQTAQPKWRQQLKKFVSQHWPSIAVLATGLLLISIMMRRQPPKQIIEEDPDEDILSIQSTTVEPTDNPTPEIAIAQSEDYVRREAEQRLNRMVEKDPDSAAKVIESWIRNAG